MVILEGIFDDWIRQKQNSELGSAESKTDASNFGTGSAGFLGVPENSEEKHVAENESTVAFRPEKS